jgi:hypothetical protein
LGRDEVSHVLRLGQALALFLDRLEDSVVNLVLDTHGFQGQEQLAVGIPWAAEHGRDAFKVHVLGQFLNPWG